MKVCWGIKMIVLTKVDYTNKVHNNLMEDFNNLIFIRIDKTCRTPICYLIHEDELELWDSKRKSQIFNNRLRNTIRLVRNGFYDKYKKGKDRFSIIPLMTSINETTLDQMRKWMRLSDEDIVKSFHLCRDFRSFNDFVLESEFVWKKFENWSWCEEQPRFYKHFLGYDKISEREMSFYKKEVSL